MSDGPAKEAPGPAPCMSLPTELWERINALFALPGDVAQGVRPSCKLFQQALSKEAHSDIVQQLSQPLPEDADEDDLVARYEPSMQYLTRRDRLGLLARAAASGSVKNVDVALRLVEPRLCPELWPAPGDYIGWYSGYYTHCLWSREQEYMDEMRFRDFLLRNPDANAAPRGEPLWSVPAAVLEASRTEDHDPGVAAVKAGHVHLLHYMVQRCCPMDPCRVVAAAAAHRDLAGLKATWRAVAKAVGAVGGAHGWRRKMLAAAAAEGAGRSATPDAWEKAAWVIGMDGAAEGSPGAAAEDVAFGARGVRRPAGHAALAARQPKGPAVQQQAVV